MWWERGLLHQSRKATLRSHLSRGLKEESETGSLKRMNASGGEV